MLVMHVIMITICTMFMMMVVSVIMTATRPIRRMFMGMAAYRKQIHRRTR
jgi:hypothetical protein